MPGLIRDGGPTALRALIAAAITACCTSSVFAQPTEAPTLPKDADSRRREELPPAPGPVPTPEARVGERLSFSAGVDFTSHFISFGADVWGGGDDANPFSNDGTMFAYGTVTAKITDELSGFVNVWSDVNNNAEDSLGGRIQEIDLNVGLTYTFNKFTVGLAHNMWAFAGDNENAVELSLAFDDKGSYAGMLPDDMGEGFGLSPSVLVHYRYEGNGGQEDDVAVIQLAIRPSFTFMADSDYPITLAVPAAVAFFTDDYQGGDGGGFGYVNVGLAASVPLAFIPTQYGSWTAGASATYWHTDDDSIPGNPEDDFLVTSVSIGVSF